MDIIVLLGIRSEDKEEEVIFFGRDEKILSLKFEHFYNLSMKSWKFSTEQKINFSTAVLLGN